MILGIEPVKRIRVSVTVATGTLEAPVRVQTVRVSVTVARGVDDSLGVSGAMETEVDRVGGGDEELGGLGGGTTTETLVETTTEVDATTEVDVSTSNFLVAERLEAKSTFELVSPSVILPLR